MKSLGQHYNIMSLGQLKIFHYFYYYHYILLSLLLLLLLLYYYYNIIKIKRLITVCLILDEL